MKGQIFELSKSLNTDILAFREHRSELCFYAPNIDGFAETDFLKAEKEGVFTNFYPADMWYEAVLESFINAEIPEFEAQKTRTESVKRTLSLCGIYAGEKAEFPEIKEAKGLDGITFNSKIPSEEIKENSRFDMEDAAFYLYSACKKADAIKGDVLSLTKEAKRLLLSMAFLEADIKRCIKRKDTSVLYKRARKCAEYYLEYYYEGGIDKREKGRVSKAYFKFSSAIFYLFGSNALQDDNFIV